MKFPLPSFRTQILLVVFLLILNSILFFRNYFLDSFQQNQSAEIALLIDRKLNDLYLNYGKEFKKVERESFKQEIEDILKKEQELKLVRSIFQKEMKLYSGFIFIFVTVVVLILFFISFTLIAKPLQRLELATESLKSGNWDIHVTENRFSPLNGLIQSFNTMASELDSQRKKLIQAEKEGAWRQMARILAHEIKNPLTPINLSLDRLKTQQISKSVNLDEIIKSTITVIEEEVKNLHDFSQEFSLFARMPATSFKQIELENYFTHMIKPYEDQLKISLLQKSIPSNMEGDSVQIKQLLTNLIQNSIQNSETDGELTISVFSSESTLNISVKDNGCGMNEEELEQLFEPYFSKRKGGTGLGLAIVKKIIEQHNGTISVSSIVGKGTTFNIELPLQQIIV